MVLVWKRGKREFEGSVEVVREEGKDGVREGEFSEGLRGFLGVRILVAILRVLLKIERRVWRFGEKFLLVRRKDMRLCFFCFRDRW